MQACFSIFGTNSPHAIRCHARAADFSRRGLSFAGLAADCARSKEVKLEGCSQFSSHAALFPLKFSTQGTRKAIEQHKVRRVLPTSAQAGYVLLETVLATGLLLVGLAVIGGQLQDSDSAVRKMNLKIRAVMLAEMHLAEMDLGLIELDSVDAIQEEDFGPRFKDWGWRLTIEQTAIKDMFLLRTDVLYRVRETYESEDFDFDQAESIYTLYAMRATPKPLDLTTEFGLSEKQTLEITEKLAAVGGGFDPASFDPAILAKLPFEELVEVLPPLLEAFGVPLSQVTQMLPPDVREQLEKAGLLGGDEEDPEDAGQTPDGGEGGEQPNPEEEGEVDE